MSSTDAPVHLDYCRAWADELLGANADMAVVVRAIDACPPASDVGSGR